MTFQTDIENTSGDGQSGEAGSGKDLSRREFLHKSMAVAGWGVLFASAGAGLYQGLRFLYPSVVFHPPSKYVIGHVKDFITDERPDQYGVIFVDNRFKKAHRFFVVREKGRVYALFARCTHLGCTVNWFEDLNIFKCPCHGSEFHSNGVEFAGPAPRPLDRHHITMDSNGNLIVDTALVYSKDVFEEQKIFVEIG
ncbi:MAG: Rieske 2Fe-2S domain-containing protein [Thermodesulfobacteriota bacterium]|nr:Rieske 2Fe-2S domain-containing protein [Thermodesulfobacteriota bacterium]